jgi:hypothetical protein
MDIKIEEALSVAEKVFKLYVLEFLDYVVDEGGMTPELEKHIKLKKIFEKFGKNISKSSIFYIPEEKTIATIDEMSSNTPIIWKMEIMIGDLSKKTDLKAHERFISRLPDDKERRAASTFDFQTVVNKLFVSLGMTYDYLAKSNPIFKHLELMSFPNLGCLGIRYIGLDTIRYQKYLYINIIEPGVL